jgi:hypothetical protein
VHVPPGQDRRFLAEPPAIAASRHLREFWQFELQHDASSHPLQQVATIAVWPSLGVGTKGPAQTETREVTNAIL